MIAETYDEFVCRHVEFYCRLAQVTPRPTLALLQKSLEKAFETATQTQIDSFARLVVRTFSHVRGVGRSATTGQRLEPDVLRLIKVA